MPEADQGIKRGLDSRLFQHLSNHRVSQMLSRVQGSSRQLVKGSLAGPPETLTDQKQFVVLIEHYTAGADVVGCERRYESIGNQLQSEHQVLLRGVVKGEA